MKYKLLDSYKITMSSRQIMENRNLKRIKEYHLTGTTPGGNSVDFYGRTKFALNTKLERILKKEEQS